MATSVSFVGVGTRSSFSAAATVTPALPAGVSAGLLLIAHVAIKNNATISTPSGWTKLGQTNSGTGLTSAVYWKIAAASEAAPVFTWSGSVAGFGQVVAYRSSLAAAIGASVSVAGTGTTHASTAITTTAANSTVIYLDAGVANTAIATPSGWTEDYDAGSATGTTRNAGGHKDIAAASGTSSGAISVVGSAGVYVQWQIELLVDPAARTIVYQSDTLTTGWLTSADALATGVADPDGALVASRVTDNAGSNRSVADGFTPPVINLPVGQYVAQVDVKASGPAAFLRFVNAVSNGDRGAAYNLIAGTALRPRADQYGGVVDSYGITPLGNGWFTAWVAFTLTTAGAINNGNAYSSLGLSDADFGTNWDAVQTFANQTSLTATRFIVSQGATPIARPSVGGATALVALPIVTSAPQVGTPTLGGGTAIVLTGPTWDTAFKGADLDLSAGNTVAQRARSTVTYTSTRSAQSFARNADVYFEVEFTVAGSSSNELGIGIAGTGWTVPDNEANWNTTNAFGWWGDGNVYAAGGSLANLGGFPSGTHRMCIAYKGSTGRFYAAMDAGGNWNNSGTANPVTNVGGVDVSAAISGTGALFASLTVQYGTGAVKLVDPSNYARTVPSGFTPLAVAASARAWTPADDTSGVLLSWVDVSDAATLTDVGSGVISAIADKKSGAGSWAQSTSGKRGTRTAANANLNGMPTISVPAGGGYVNSAITLPQTLRMGTAPDGGNAFQISLNGTDGGPNGSMGTLPRNAVFGTQWNAGSTYGPGGANNAETCFVTGAQAPIIYDGDGGAITSTGSGAIFVVARMKGISQDSSGYGRFFDSNGGSCLLNRASDYARTGNMDLGESIVLVGSVPTALRQKYEGYLAWKWGLQADLPTGHPYKAAAPTVAASGGTVALTATGVTAGTPVVGQPTLGQTHLLTATPVTTSAPQVGSPAVGQVHALTASAIVTSAPVVGIATLGQRHALTGNPVVTSAPSVGTPSVAQTHVLAASAVVTAAPQIGAPALGQTHVLTAAPVASSSPQVGAAVFGQVHALSALPVATSAPQVGTPSLVPSSALTATPVVTSTPAIGTPSLAQTHVLAATPVTTSTPSVGTPAVGQNHQLGTPLGVTTSTPFAGFPAIAQTHALTGLPVVPGAAVVGNPVAGVVGQLTGQPAVAGVPQVGTPTLGQTHNLGTPLPVVGGTPETSLPIMRQINSLAGQPIITGTPSAGTPAIGQTHRLTAAPVTGGVPTAGFPVLGQTSVLVPLGITTAAPAAGTPAVGQTHVLASGVPASPPTPVVGTPVVGQTHVITATDVVTAQPAVGMPAIGQVHVLEPVGVSTGPPVVGQPKLFSGKGDANPPALWLAI